MIVIQTTCHVTQIWLRLHQHRFMSYKIIWYRWQSCSEWMPPSWALMVEMVRMNWFRIWEPHHIPERQDENKGTHCEVPLCRPWIKVSFGFPQLGPNFRRIHRQWTLLDDTYRLVACFANQINMTQNIANASRWTCFNVTERTIHLDKRARQYFKAGTEIVLLSNRPIHSIISAKPGPAKASVRNAQIPWRAG